MKTATKRPEITSPPNHIREMLIEREGELAILPDVASEALTLTREPDCCVTQIARLLEKDLELSIDILKTANSTAFGGGAGTACLRDAVIRIGLDRCRDLIFASCTASLMKRISVEQHWIRDALWQHSYATGICCQLLNDKLKLGLRGEEFTAGLIHDIGRLLLASLLPEQFGEGDTMNFGESDVDFARERSVFGTDHTEVGSWFAQRNGLPDVLVDVIRSHHSPQDAIGNQPIVALVYVADRMASHLQHNLTAEGFDSLAIESVSGFLSDNSEMPSILNRSINGLLEIAWEQLRGALES